MKPINTPEEFEALPQEDKDVLMPVLERFQNMENTYETCGELVEALNEVGWTCEYYLDALPFNFRKILTKDLAESTLINYFANCITVTDFVETLGLTDHEDEVLVILKEYQRDWDAIEATDEGTTAEQDYQLNLIVDKVYNIIIEL